MERQTLKVYKTETAKRGTEVTSDFILFDEDVVNGRIRVIAEDGEIYWVLENDWARKKPYRGPIIENVWG